MGKATEKIILNIGCGFRKLPGMINVDAYANCKPDVLWNLNTRPWPWADNSIDMIHATHIMEHLDNWWSAFKECARILKVGGVMEMYVPHHTSTQDMVYIDHKAVIGRNSFHMIMKNEMRGTNAWAKGQDRVPMAMVGYILIPHPHLVKWWIPKRLLKFACEHMTNFCHEQRFTFIKTSG